MELPSLSCFAVHAAAWVPFGPEQGGQLGGQAAFPRLKTSCRGLWLRASEAAALGIDVRPSGPALLTLNLKGHRQLAACPVTREALHCTVLCPAHSGASCWVLFLRLRGAGKESTFALKFESDQAGQECAAVIQALLAGTAGRVQAGGSATSGLGPQLGRLIPGELQGSEPADLKEQIKAYLADPEFMAFVDQVEQAWIELEQSLEEGG